MGGAASQHENELVLDVQRLSEPAFAVNSAHQIVAWNDGAERLLGLRADEVIGLRCYEALATSQGSLCVDCRYRCGPNGPIGLRARTTRGAEAANERRSLADGGTFISTPRSDRKRVNVTTIAAHTRTGQLRVVHLLHDAPAAPHDAQDGGDDQGAPPAESVPAASRMPQRRVLPAALAAQAQGTSLLADKTECGGKQRRPALLTQRELEVLRLLGAGHSTDDIAQELSITRVTARNHVNKVLDKLGVNSRLQAVVIASQLQLI